MFEEFMSDPTAWDMYRTGQAGTGKTTMLHKDVSYCMSNNIPHVVCAFTHKACDILRSKLPNGANVMTLHKFLKKRPGVNEHALNKRSIDINVRQGTSERPVVMFIDEYSMIGEQDGMDIRAEQDPKYEGQPGMKVVWIGDPNQLPPVGDIAFVRPYGKYQEVLTKIYRQADGNPLLDTLTKLVRMIEGKEELGPLAANSRFIREVDLIEEYLKCDKDKVLLAYTNRQVEALNRKIQGYAEPKIGDTIYSPSTKATYTYNGPCKDPVFINLPYNGDILQLGSKYKTLEHLIEAELCDFCEVIDEDGNPLVFASTFGHYRNKQKIDSMKTAAALANREIEQANPGYKAAGWAKANWRTPMARTRAKAWRDYFSYNECVVCLDFAHATTVHKSQGSTYDTVFIDTDDLFTAASIDTQQYLKLMYVAISRASNKVYTS